MQLIEQCRAEVLVNERDVTPHVPNDPGGCGEVFCDAFRSFLHPQESL
jgi:hypothetical protein